MLTADLVNARRRGGELRLIALDAEARERALVLARALIASADAHVGNPREEFLTAVGGLDISARERRLKDGLAKLVEDRCEFEGTGELDPVALRRELFSLASAARAETNTNRAFDRARIIAEAAARHGTSSALIERSLFADLRGAQTLVRFASISPEALVATYEDAQAQAVMLRAVKVTVDIRSASAASLRGLFRQLRFLRLLHAIDKTEDGYRVVIDGPYSLFESVTKYGLQLALALPALKACDRWQLEADIRWGKDRLPLIFRLAGASASMPESAPLPDEVETLRQTFAALESDWTVAVNQEILELVGVGLSVPDLVFERKGMGGPPERVYLEVMGYWSRAAVWRRVELVQAGLAERILFAVSAHLRVSEEVLSGELPSALYVYKRAMNARTIADRLEQMVSRAPPLP